MIANRSPDSCALGDSLYRLFIQRLKKFRNNLNLHNRKQFELMEHRLSNLEGSRNSDFEISIDHAHLFKFNIFDHTDMFEYNKFDHAHFFESNKFDHAHIFKYRYNPKISHQRCWSNLQYTLYNGT